MTEKMVITELYIKNFGMLSEKHIRFTDGVQVIYGENESGKSTLHGFIRAMLFGLERGRGKAAPKDDFTRYEPWENPGNYAGVLWFLCGGKQFRLERNFDRYTKRTALICETDGEELSVEHGDLEMLSGGMTAALYDSTVSIGQLAAAPGQELSRALENYAAGFCETGGADIDVNGALKCLKERLKDAERLFGEKPGTGRKNSGSCFRSVLIWNRIWPTWRKNTGRKKRAFPVCARKAAKKRRRRRYRMNRRQRRSRGEPGNFLPEELPVCVPAYWEVSGDR